MNENFNDYFRRNSYIGTSTSQVDSITDDWSDYFSKDININKTYNEVEEVQRTLDTETFMNACPVVIKKNKTVVDKITEDWSVYDINESQSRIVAMQEQWNAMQASFNETLSYEEQSKMSKELEDDVDMIIPGIKSSLLSEVAKIEQEKINTNYSMDNEVKTLNDVVDNEHTECKEERNNEVDASLMSNEELLANLGIEINNENTEPIIEFNSVTVDEHKDIVKDDVIEVVEDVNNCDVIIEDTVEEVKVIEDKSTKKTTKKSSTQSKKTSVKTNKTTSTKTNKSTSKKK